MEFKSVIPSRKSGFGPSNNPEIIKAQLGYSINRNKKGGGRGGGPTLSVVFYIGNHIMKEARIIKGDFVDVHQSDCKEYGLIKRVNHPLGRKVSENAFGKSSHRFSFKRTKAFPIVSHKIVLENVVINDEGILFQWPKKETPK